MKVHMANINRMAGLVNSPHLSLIRSVCHSPGNKVYSKAELAISSTAAAKTITSIH